ncbi:hypothetical protein SAMN04488505_110237 [Chitinophaga rupis]|uniref:Uncharacterized protein n=1 Tax=Chitinophaga rupis TaxID=573321 RepID=A0A1H8GT34_9BACT|nr:hypothetical protein SAMN04488505_110237 [Chitinophaga rupis]
MNFIRKINYRSFKGLSASAKFMILTLPFLGIFVVVSLIQRHKHDKWLAKDGVYLIASVSDVHTRKSGITIEATCYLNGKLLKLKSSVDRRRYYLGQRIFIRIVPEDPDIYEVVEWETVQDCLKKADSMFKSWKQIPRC